MSFLVPNRQSPVPIFKLDRTISRVRLALRDRTTQPTQRAESLILY
ncbi:hypothetical protein [Scytonema sp. NUACC26]